MNQTDVIIDLTPRDSLEVLFGLVTRLGEKRFKEDLMDFFIIHRQMWTSRGYQRIKNKT